MATVSGEHGQRLVAKIIKDNDGWPDDKEVALDNPRCVKIVQYTNIGGGTSWGLVFETNVTEISTTRRVLMSKNRKYCGN